MVPPLYDTAGWSTSLPKPGLSRLDELIQRRYPSMYDAYLTERALIPPGRLHEIAFADLERDPLGTMEGLYAALTLPGFDHLRPKLAASTTALGGDRKNRYEGLTPELRARVAGAWSRSFEVWGYPREPSVPEGA